jgi:hypothetical protein
LKCGLLAKAQLAAGDRVLYCVQQDISTEWFGQEFKRAGSHRLNGHRHVAVSGDEDDRQVGLVDGDLFLEIEAVEIG